MKYFKTIISILSVVLILNLFIIFLFIISLKNKTTGATVVSNIITPEGYFMVGNSKGYAEPDNSINLSNGDLNISNDLNVTGTTTVSGYLDISLIHHAYGGIMATSVTVSLTQNNWATTTNADGNLFTGLEANGMTLSNDIMTFQHGAHYTGSLALSVSGGNGNDYEFRFYDITSGAQEGYTVYKTTDGTSNYQTVTMPIYFDIDSGDSMIIQVRNLTDNDDIIIKSGIFNIFYSHD